MKNSQSGFSLLEGLLILVILGIVGGVGWLVYDRQSKNKADNPQSNQTQQSDNNQTETKKEQSKTYTDSFSGYSFEYPSDWQLSTKEDKGYFDQRAEKLTTYNIVTVKSPDAKVQETEGPGGFQVLEGAAFIVSATPATGETGPTFNATVDGQQATQQEYNPSPHSEYFTGTYFRKGTLDYSIDHWYPKDGKAEYSSQYQALLSSFKTNK